MTAGDEIELTKARDWSTIRLSAEGGVWIDDRDVPNAGIRFEKDPGGEGTLRVRVPLVDLTGPQPADGGPPVLLFVASLPRFDEPGVNVFLEASAPTIGDALRELARQVDEWQAAR